MERTLVLESRQPAISIRSHFHRYKTRIQLLKYFHLLVIGELLHSTEALDCPGDRASDFVYPCNRSQALFGDVVNGKTLTMAELIINFWYL